MVLSGVDEARLSRMAELVALFARPGDVIALGGELGAGKTTFARAFVRAVLDDPGAEVPSPTFNLLQTYASPRFPIAHLDLYRLAQAADLGEVIGDDTLRSAVTVVEWPDRANSLLPSSRLDVAIAETDQPSLRNLELAGDGAWTDRLDRLGQVQRFLLRELGQEASARAHLVYLQGDASPRAYARIRHDDATRVLMNAPRMPDGPPIRAGLPYSRIAHLAEDVRPFVALGRALEARGIAAPRIHAHDLDKGLLLLEDLGDLTLGRAVGEGVSQRELWGAAVDTLVAVRRAGALMTMPLPDGTSHALSAYDRDALGIETGLLLDWYWPMLHGQPPSAPVRETFAQLWEAEFDRLLALPQGLVLRDFHSPNLMWRPGQQGLARVGVLDFQDALRGPWAYDLVSLLQDARVDVPERLEAELFARYCDRMAAIEPDFDRTSFAYAYAALGAQRNTKILGIFARLARRDGKTVYLQHIPRIWSYLQRDLAAPALAPLRAWYDRHFPQPVRAVVPAP
jgi:N-acetylmuramate 1-kinase